MKKNILIIAYFFAPNSLVGAKRMSFLTYYLKDSFNFFVLTLKNDNIPNKDEKLKYNGQIIGVKEFPKFEVPHTNLFNRAYNKFFRKVAPIDIFSGWAFAAILKGKKILKENKIDKIIVSGPPFSQFYVGYFLSKKFNVPLILDYRDPWILNNKKNRLEKKILKHTKYIIFTTEKAEDGYLNSEFKEIVKGKTTVIPNAYMKNNSSPILLEKNKKVIFYAGNFYKERKLSYLFEPLVQLYKNGFLKKDEIRIHIFGNFLEEDKKELEKINWKGLVVKHSVLPYNEIFAYMKGADLLYLPQVTYGEYAIPYKFFDYASVKKPILAITSLNSSTAKIVKKIDCGEVASPVDSNMIYEGLKKILVLNKKYEFNVENLSWESIATDFINVFVK